MSPDRSRRSGREWRWRGDRGITQQFTDWKIVRLLDQRARLQSGDEKDEAFDQIDDRSQKKMP